MSITYVRSLAFLIALVGMMPLGAQSRRAIQMELLSAEIGEGDPLRISVRAAAGLSGQRVTIVEGAKLLAASELNRFGEAELVVWNLASGRHRIMAGLPRQAGLRSEEVVLQVKGDVLPLATATDFWIGASGGQGRRHVQLVEGELIVNQHRLEIAGARAAALDADLDGRIDLIVATSEELVLLLARLDGTYDPAVKIARWPRSRSAIKSLLPGDFNGDGRWDVLLGRNPGMELWEGSPTEPGMSRKFGAAAARQAAKVSGLVVGEFIAIAAGDFHSLALNSDGTVWAWGRNGEGELGDGSNVVSRLAPVQVSGLTGVVAIAAGSNHSLALKSDGSVWGWGTNGSGQLGDGTMANRLTPVQVSGLTGVEAIAAGFNYSLALLSNGTVRAWGFNFYGALGDGTTTTRLTPVQVVGLTGVTEVAAGQYHSMALRSDGVVLTWGYNSNGQLGDGTTTNSPLPIVSGFTQTVSVEAGSHHSLALRNDETVRASGWNLYGQIGDGTGTQRLTPVNVFSGAVAIAGGYYHTLAARSDGSAWAWGFNGFGGLGNGTTTHSQTPLPVSGLTGVVAVAGGLYHSLALTSDGRVWAWGYNLTGQLGDGTTTQRQTPVRVSDPGVPGAPGNVSPTPGQTNVSTSTALAWSAAAGATSYDVFFGTVSPPPLLTTTTGLFASPGLLGAGQTYYWRIVARNAAGTAASPIWQFTTMPLATATGTLFVPINPCRLADTRLANGEFGGPVLTRLTTRSFDLRSHPCIAGADPVAYSLNITVVPTVQLGYLSIWPTGTAQPTVSTLNSLDGRIKANAAIVAAGVNRAVSVYVTDNAHVIIDINGYFVNAPSANGLAFYPVTPCRVSDTRNATGPRGGPALVALQTRSIPVLSSSCGIPASAQAYSLNATVVPQGQFGFLSVWPTGLSQPVVSTLNALTGTVTANAAIVRAGTSGEVSVYATDRADLILDINGYFAPPGGAGALRFNPTGPCRILDTRVNPPILTATVTRDVPVPICGSSILTAQAYTLNATVLPQGVFGYLALWPQGLAQPLVSTLNAVDGALTSNLAIVPTASPGGGITAFGSNTAHLILDLSGYFAP